MPEVVEVKMMSEFCNKFSHVTKISSLQTMPISKWKDISFHVNDPAISLPYLGFSFSFRGKEIALDLYNEDQHYKRVLFQMGMSGSWLLCTEETWSVTSSIRNNTVFRILISRESKEAFLVLHDTRRFAKWYEVEKNSWGKNRGPCVYNEREDFKENVLLSLSKKAFEAPIYEVLLNQSYFNGIGNYLRALIIYKTNNNFSLSARDYIKKNEKTFFNNIFDTIDEVNFCYNEDHFPVDFFYPYGSGKSLIDSKKRKFWYHEDKT